MSRLAFIIAILSFGNAFSQERTTIVQLFEWSWRDITEECRFLGEAGYRGVQVSPPQESIDGSPWWTRYQPVSYRISGRGGSEDEFREMVQACAAEGVEIYVDAVINHMAAGDRSYPGVPYVRTDFNECFEPIDYGNKGSIQYCDLQGLNDLKTGSRPVQEKIAAYLNSLIDIGVKGFRIDAAKHIPAQDLRAIKGLLSEDVLIYQEVIGSDREPVSKFEYTDIGVVTEFNYGRVLGHAFKGHRSLSGLRGLKDWNGWLSSDRALVFTDNHDTQRSEPFEVMTHRDLGARYFIANVFMLAYPYGVPRVMSSYSFQSTDGAPPAQGVHTGARCYDGQWMCEHRWEGIASMVGFRNATQSQKSLDYWWDNQANQIAFSRGSLGFVAINGENFPLVQKLKTGLPSGLYCNVITGALVNGECQGEVLEVQADTSVQLNISPLNAIAIHHLSRVP